MNKTKIEWVINPDGSRGFTWNVVTGCLHGCDYCYARKIANRFAGTALKRKFIEDTQVEQVIDGVVQEFLLEEHPGFYPTLWDSRLEDPVYIKKPSTIFAGSMADLFGKWIPEIWIERILKTVKKCPQHTFLFLTKNGSGMCEKGDVIDTENAWYGQTCTGIPGEPIYDIPNGRHFLSFEPLLGDDWIPDQRILHINWVIVGSLNRNGKAVHPDNGGTKKEWALKVIAEAERLNIPIFIKSELLKLYPGLPERKDLPYQGNKHEKQ